MSTYILGVDENVPLPPNATDALPPMSAKEELEVRARTIKLIADLQGKTIEPDEQDKEQARELAKKMMSDPVANIDFANYRNETLAYKALGEVDGVDAFKKRSEVTVQVKSLDQVEKDLLAKLEKLERLTNRSQAQDIVDVETTDADPREDTEA